MSKIMEEITKELVDYEKIEAAKRMLDDGTLSVDKIAKFLELPVEVVEKLENKLQLV